MNHINLITDYYIAHHDELLAYASSRLGDSMEAEDVVQNVFLRLLTTDKMISATTLPALVYTMMRHQVMDYFRRHTTFEQYEHYIKRACIEETSTESVFSVREIIEQMERGLAHLPEPFRPIYRMHVYGGMKVSEISKQLGEGYKIVENRLYIARKAIRKRLLAVGF